MSENVRIAKNSIILYTRLIIVLFIGVLSARFILQALGASDFGLYNVVGGIVAMMAVLNNVMISTTYRYIAMELGSSNEEGVNKVFNISLVIHITLAAVVLILAETVGIYFIKNHINLAPGKLDDAIFVFRLSILSTIFTILSIPYQGLIFAKEKFAIFASVEIFRSVLAFIVVLLVLFFAGNRLRLYASLISLITILPSLFYYFYTRKYFTQLIEWKFQRSKTQYKGMVNFSGWLLFGAAASVGEIQGSVLLINMFFGTIINASYGIANQVNTMVKMFAQSLNQAAIPQITTNYGGGNTNRSMQLVIFSSKYAFFLMLLPSLPLLLETDFILKLWLKNVPQYTAIFMKLMVINALISTMNSGLYTAVQASGKIKYFQIILGTFTILGLPCSYFLFLHGYPVYTILLVYTFIYVVNFFLYHILIKRITNFDIEEFYAKAIKKMVSIALIILPLFLLAKVMDPGITRLIIVTLLSLLWTLLAIYFVGMDNKEKLITGTYINKLISRFSSIRTS